MNQKLRTNLFNSIHDHLCVAKAARTDACIRKVEPLIDFLAGHNGELSIREYENLSGNQHIRGVALITNSGLSIQFSKAGAAIDIAIGVMRGSKSIPILPNDDVVTKTCKYFNLGIPNQKVA